MSGIVFGGISPHPPIIVPAVGRNDLKAASQTRTALAALAADIQQVNPDTIVIITPHGPVFQDAVAIWNLPELTGSFAEFGVVEPVYTIRNDLRLAEMLALEAERLGVTVLRLDRVIGKRYGLKPRLDHGILVPLSFFREAGVTAPVLPVTMGYLTLEDLYKFGKALQRAASLLEKKVAVIASADLSHRLTPEAPAGYTPAGKEFDTTLVERLKQGDVAGVLATEESLREQAGECGFLPIVMLLGALDGLDIHPKILSYEGPFGVGYLVARFLLGDPNPERELLPRLARSRTEKAKTSRESEGELVALARRSLESYLLDRKTIRPPQPLSPALSGQAGAFVSLKKDGKLRGCIGTTGPTQENLALEIIHNAISAGTEDPRFHPVHASELDELVYSVDVLGEAEPVSDLSDLDPVRYGVIVRQGQRTGLLLPNLEGVATVEEQLSIARQKAGIGPTEKAEILRFEVVRHH